MLAGPRRRLLAALAAALILLAWFLRRRQQLRSSAPLLVETSIPAPDASDTPATPGRPAIIRSESVQRESGRRSVSRESSMGENSQATAGEYTPRRRSTAATILQAGTRGRLVRRQRSFDYISTSQPASPESRPEASPASADSRPEASPDPRPMMTSRRSSSRVMLHDAFLTHDWADDSEGRSNHLRVCAVKEQLEAEGVKCWLDEEQMQGDINARMTEGVDTSAVVVVFITKRYCAKVAGKGKLGANDNCKFEFDYALLEKGVERMAAAVMEPAMTDTKAWTGVVKGKLGGHLYINMSADVGDPAFAAGVQQLVREIRARAAKAHSSPKPIPAASQLLPKTPSLKAQKSSAPSMERRRTSASTGSITSTSNAAADKPYAGFVSHMKAEVAMEARFLQEKLEEELERPVFLDSDDLRDLTKLKQHVRDCDTLILIQSKDVLSRPYCLLELLTALEEGVPIVGLSITGGSAAYDFGEALNFLKHLDTRIDVLNPGASELLAANGWPDMQDVARLLSSTLPARISVPFHSGASRTSLSASVEDLAKAMRSATPVALDSLPSKEQFLYSRKRTSLVRRTEHGSASKLLPPAPKAALVPSVVPKLQNITLQPRPSLLSSIKESVLEPETSRVLVHGFGGVGKTVLAAEFVNDPEVRGAFERICWLTVSQNINLLSLLRALHHQVTSNPLDAQATEIPAATAAVRGAVHGIKTLLVLDDCWDVDKVDALNVVDANCGSVVLITTRIRRLLSKAAEVECDLLSKDESLEMLLRCGDVDHLIQTPPPAALELVELCGGLPLTLAIAGSLIQDLQDKWTEELVPMLRDDNAAELREHGTGAAQLSVEDRIIAASLQSIKHVDAAGVLALFTHLAIFPADACVPSAVFDALAPLIAKSAAATGGKGGLETKSVARQCLDTRRWLQELLRASLVNGSIADGIETHDLVQKAARSRAHDELVEMQRAALVALIDARPVGGFRPVTFASTQACTASAQLNRYVALHLKYHIAGAAEAGVPVQDDAILARALQHEDDIVREQVSVGLGERRMLAAIEACTAEERWQDVARWQAVQAQGLVYRQRLALAGRQGRRDRNKTPPKHPHRR